MNNYEIEIARETFCRLFVLAKDNMIHLGAFTTLLERSSVASAIEKGIYSEIFDKPLEYIFNNVCESYITADTSYGKFNDAYWAGQSYFELQAYLKKPFSYIFLKLPLEKMMDLYPVYHEMDISSLKEYFSSIEYDKTIIRILCTNYHYSLSDISEKTGININSLVKYNANDENLYNSSFRNIYKLSHLFDVPINIFAKEV